jgi:hypothetical protein
LKRKQALSGIAPNESQAGSVMAILNHSVTSSPSSIKQMYLQLNVDAPALRKCAPSGRRIRWILFASNPVNVSLSGTFWASTVFGFRQTIS